MNVGSTTGSLQLLLDHQDAIAPEHNDPIHELLDDLGEVPTIESLIGNVLHSLLKDERERVGINVIASEFALYRILDTLWETKPT